MSHPRPPRLLLALLLTCLWMAGCSKDTDSSDTNQDKDADTTEVAAGKEKDADGTETAKDSDGDKKKKKKKRDRATAVNAAKVFRGDLVVPVIAEGTIRTRQSADVRAEIGGRLVRIFVEEGQSVRKGQKIAELDSREYQIAIEEAHARYLSAIGQIAVEEEMLEADEGTEEISAK